MYRRHLLHMALASIFHPMHLIVPASGNVYKGDHEWEVLLIPKDHAGVVQRGAHCHVPKS